MPNWLLGKIPVELRSQVENGTLLQPDFNWKVENYNQSVGDLKGYDCPECKNRGLIMFLRDGYEVMRECRCMEIRKNMRRIKQSGLDMAIDSMTFDTYRCENEWQRNAKNTALSFVSGWFFLGGQVGAGKTHLGTAIVGKFLHSGKSARYMMWRDEIVEIKASVNNAEAYQKLTNPLKTVELLYIDDFFKTEQGRQPTQADVNLAHELLNHRYVNKLPTIISSELFVEDILNIDEAVGSRIYQMSKGQCVEISRDKSKNWRLK